MHSLSTADLIIIAGYFLLTLVMGLVMTRRASRNLDEYYLGGHSLPWYLLGMAGMVSWFDLTGTMIITSFLYLLGPRGLFIEFRGGALDGGRLGPDDVKAVAKWPSRAEQLSILSGQISSVGSMLSGQLISAGGAIASQLKTRMEELEKAEA